MDFNIYSAPNHEIFKHDWWNNPLAKQEFYARRFWGLVNNVTFIPSDYKSGDWIELDKDMIEEMITVACHYKDYFDTYNNIPKLCELRDRFDELEENGRHLYFEYDF